MVSTNKDKVLAVLSLSGGNDGLNTVIPFNDGHYRDFRPNLGVSADQVIKLNDQIGLHPTMGPLKKYWDEGQAGHLPGHRLSHAQLLPLPLHGHLAHLRAGEDWHRGLAGPGYQGTGPLTPRTC